MKVSTLLMSMTAILIFLFLMSQNGIFGQKMDSASNSSNIATATKYSQNDTTRPSVNITYPAYPLTIITNKIIINGTSGDSGSGVYNVTALAHTFPFENHFPVPLASQPTPISPGNWSRWSVPLIINNSNSYRVVITAMDKAGNANYAETTINAITPRKINPEGSMMIPKVAFVRPTFTEAAYQEHGFYRFYFKHGFPPIGENVTADLDMLTVKTPISVSEFPENNIRHLSNITSLVPTNGTELTDVSQNSFPVTQKFWIPFIDNVKKVIPDAIVTVMRDEDAHDGHMFYPDNNTNAFDILLLFHNEYVTQKEYDNLRQFVKNGGTIVFIDANVFYAEVSYDRNNHTITLIKGHDWEYNGEAARRSIPERWYNETKEWVGSNFLINEIDENITFANNLFNYTHFEEQFVNNPQDRIIIDYGILFPKDYIEMYLNKEKLPAVLHREDIPIENITVASYSLEYGKGKVIMAGLSGRLLSENQEFLKFFDNAILPSALCPKFEPCVLFPITHYLYICTNSEYIGYHCDQVTNEYESKPELMIPIQINATNINVSNVNYSEKMEKIAVALTDRHSLSTFSIKIPKSITATITDSYGCQFKAEVPYHLAIQRYETYNIFTVQLQADAPENLLFTINMDRNSPSKMNICLRESEKA